MKESSTRELERRYAPLNKELYAYKYTIGQAARPRGMWGFPLNIMWLMLFPMGLYLLNKGQTVGGGTILLLTGAIYWYIRRGVILEQIKDINDAAKFRVIKRFIELFCKEQGVEWEYVTYASYLAFKEHEKHHIAQGYVMELFFNPYEHYLPENISAEEFDENLKSVSGYGRSELVMDDIITGRNGEVNFHYCNVSTYNEEYGEASYKGELLMLHFNRSVAGHLYIGPDTLEKEGGFVGKGLQKSIQSSLPFEDALIRMDDPEFENHFAVYGTDKVLAHYILTHTFMENLTKLAKLHASKIYIRLHGEWMFIMLKNSENKFEFSLESRDVPDEIFTLHRDFAMLLKIIETIDLNMHEMNIR